MDAPDPVAFAAEGLYFREWSEGDVEQMVRLFNTDEMNRWTPLPFPFTVEVALAYVAGAREARVRDGTLQLAVSTAPGGAPVGEVIVFPGDERDTVELAYAVGADHRGRRIGARSVVAALDAARSRGAQRAVLTIANDNVASQATARSAGFTRTDLPLRRRERKGFVLEMETWERRL